MITHNITLRVKDQNAVDTGIAVSQGDYGHVQFVMYVKDDDKYITDAEKAEVVFNTPNGYIVTGDAVIKNGTYTYVFSGNELQAPGKISATLTLTFSDGRASACNFVFECRYNALYDRGISAGNYITQIENLTQRAEEALSAADGAAALAEMAKIAAVAAQNAAEIAAANAEAVSGVGIATINKAGLVKPDGATTDVDADGALSVILTDTQGLVGNANAEVTLQAFVDVIADKVANQMFTKAGLVNNGLATQAGVAALDAAYGKTLLDLYTKLNSDLSILIKTVTFNSPTSTYSEGSSVDIPITIPEGYKAVGTLGINTKGFIGSAYAFLYDDRITAWIAKGGTGTVEVNVLFVKEIT